MKKVTSDNCKEWAKEWAEENNTGGIKSAWACVYTFAVQHGLKNIHGKDGLENLIIFLERRLNDRRQVHRKSQA